MAALPEIDSSFPVEEEVDDVSDTEEKAFVSILLKLKAAKSAVEQNRKRKQNKEIVREIQDKCRKDCQEIVKRYTKKWQLKSKSLAEKAVYLEGAAQTLTKRAEVFQKNATAFINSKRQEVQKFDVLFKTIQVEAEDEIQSTKRQNRGQGIREQIDRKLFQLESALKKIQSESHREDKFTKMFKSVLTSL